MKVLNQRLLTGVFSLLVFCLFVEAQLPFLPQFPATLTLPVTYRDFTDKHPDFECCSAAPEQKIVKPLLAADGKPDYANPTQCKVYVRNAKCGPSENGHTTHGAKDFYDWYHDTKGTGILGTYNRTITLNLIDPVNGIYDYTNYQFFPLNGLAPASYPKSTEHVTGNPEPGNPFNYDYWVKDQNFAFTTHVTSTFVYRRGQNFTFIGDDDVWVFINKKLVIDLGGVHSLMHGSVDLDTLGLTAGNVYQLDVFNAERHTQHSNFRITTSICFDVCPGGPCRPDEKKCEDIPTKTPLCTQFVCENGVLSRKKRDLQEHEEILQSTGNCVEISRPNPPSSCFSTPPK